MLSAASVLVVGLMALVASSCGDGVDSSGDQDITTSSTRTVVVDPTATTLTTSSSTVTPPEYGSPCQKGSHPDCIDPDGQGSYTYLKDGDDCIKALGQESGLCSDLDRDGVAGYPDSG